MKLEQILDDAIDRNSATKVVRASEDHHHRSANLIVTLQILLQHIVVHQVVWIPALLLLLLEQFVTLLHVLKLILGLLCTSILVWVELFCHLPVSPVDVLPGCIGSEAE